MHELAASAASTDDLVLRLAHHGQHLPPTIGGLIRERVQMLPDRGDLLVWAALIGLEFELPVLEEVCGDCLEGLEGAARAGLVREILPGRWEFRHGLARDALIEEIGPSRRIRRHAAIAEALSTSAMPTTDGRIAHHLCAAAVAGATAVAVARSMSVARSRLDQLAAPEALAHTYEALWVLALEPDPDPATEAELHLLATEAHEMLVDEPARIEAAEAGIAAAKRAGRTDLLVRGALLRNAFWTQGRLDEDAARHIEDALDALGEKELGMRAHLLGSLAAMLAVSGASAQTPRGS